MVEFPAASVPTTVQLMFPSVEYGPIEDIFDHPGHPYTQALLRSIPRSELVRALKLGTADVYRPEGPLNIPDLLPLLAKDKNVKAGFPDPKGRLETAYEDLRRFLAAGDVPVDAGAYTTCTSPKAYTSLAVGAHTISVRATESVRRWRPASAVKASIARLMSATSASIAVRSSSTCAVSMTSWLVAPQCT